MSGSICKNLTFSTHLKALNNEGINSPYFIGFRRVEKWGRPLELSEEHIFKEEKDQIKDLD